MSAPLYRIIWIGNDRRPYLGDPIPLEDAVRHLEAGNHPHAGLVLEADWCNAHVSRHYRMVELDLSMYGTRSPQENGE